MDSHSQCIFPFQSTGMLSFLHTITRWKWRECDIWRLSGLISVSSRHEQHLSSCYWEVERETSEGREKMGTVKRLMCAISRLHGSPAHAVRLKRRCRIFNGSQPLPSICCLLGTYTQYMSKDRLLWAFSITLQCTAVGGGINLLVWMHATLNGEAGVPRASSVSCTGTHTASFPAAVEAISKLHHSHIKLHWD